MSYGIVYIAKHDIDDEECYKIGKSTRSISERLAELSSSTSNLGKFISKGYVVVENCDEVEKRVHKDLDRFRVQSNREFFRCSIGTINQSILKSSENLLVQNMLLQTDIRFLPKKILAEKEQKKEAKQRDAYRNTKKAQEEISKYHESLIDFIAELLSMVSSPVIKISKPTFFFNNEFIFTEFVVQEFGNQIVEIDLRQEATDKWIIDAQNYLIDRGDQKYPTTSEHFVEKLLSNFHNEGIKLEKDIVIFKKENILLSERGFYICSRLLNNSNKWSSPFFTTHANDADIFYHEDQELDEVDCEINIKNLQDKNPPDS